MWPPIIYTQNAKPVDIRIWPHFLIHNPNVVIQAYISPWFRSESHGSWIDNLRRHSLCAVDFSVSDGADKRHNLAIVKKQTHKGDGSFLFLSTHLPQNMSCGRRHGLKGRGGGGKPVVSDGTAHQNTPEQSRFMDTYPNISRLQQ